MGEIVALPFGLMLSYGAIVLAAGATLGIIVARQFRPLARPPLALPDQLEHRFAVLEEEMDYARAMIDDLVDERDFVKRLHGKASDASYQE